MTCVIVLGLPRSGTSALAGALSAMNICMGENLMPAAPGINERGFFEDLEFVRLHEAMLEGRTGLAAPDPSPDLAAAYEELVASRRKRHLWGVKDPRLCFLLPQLLSRVGSDYFVLVTERPFCDSVRSQRKLYGGMPLELASVQLGYYLFARDKSLEAVPEAKMMRVPYRHLLDSPVAVLTEVAYMIDLPWEQHLLLQKAAKTIDSKLDHARRAPDSW